MRSAFREVLAASLLQYAFYIVRGIFSAIHFGALIAIRKSISAFSALGDACARFFLVASRNVVIPVDAVGRTIEFFVTGIAYGFYRANIALVRMPRRVIASWLIRDAKHAAARRLFTLDVNISHIRKNAAERRTTGSRDSERVTVKSFSESHLPFRWHRRIAFFTFACFVLLIPFASVHLFSSLLEKRDLAVSDLEQGIASFAAGAELLTQSQSADALHSFTASLESFNSAHTILTSINATVLSLGQHIPFAGRDIASGTHLVEGGRHIARAGVIIAQTTAAIESDADMRTPYASLAMFGDALEQVVPHLNQANDHFAAVSEESLPVAFRAVFLERRNSLATMAEYANDLLESTRALRTILGETTKKRYLVLFQNNTELRATGGFLGSFALVDMDRGALTNVEIPGGGPYDLSGSLRERVIAPHGLHLIKTEWQFQDANWFPHFPDSARKAMWFYEKSGGPSVDGVIAVNASFVERLLAFTGPIPMPEYGKTITAENFMRETQYAVEFEYDRSENKPKKFISDLFPRVLEKLSALQLRDAGGLAAVFVDGALHRDIQAYMVDSAVQSSLSRIGITGELTPRDGAFLAIVNSSVGGGKSDAVITRSVSRTITLMPDGRFMETVGMRVEHPGPVRDVLYGKTNIDYARFYAPAGSVLVGARGFRTPDQSRFKEVPPQYRDDTDLKAISGLIRHDPINSMDLYAERGFEVFAGWIETRPESVHEVEISYLLPFRLSDLKRTSDGAYALPVFAYRQSGSTIRNYTLALHAPNGQARLISPEQQESEARSENALPFLNDFAAMYLIASDAKKY